ncbi:MAG: hypothetical protein JST05_01765 [Acidobacteria bacterium]|nr:hypothetical protein [Acidobacteriota bacterium]
MGFGWFKRSEAAGHASVPREPRASGPHSAAREGADRLRAEAQERDEDRRLALEILRGFQPGLDLKALAESLLNACREPFELATFYLALVDHEADRLTFPLYLEGGKRRVVAPRSFSQFSGLTTRIIQERRAFYFPTKALQEEAGVAYTDAERMTGLIPESWFGVPLGVGPGWPDPPFGVLAFQAFAQDAFSPARREIMTAFGAALALAARTDPARKLNLGDGLP